MSRGPSDWSIAASDDNALRGEVQAILRSFNEKASFAPPDTHPLLLRAMDPSGAFVGGLVGETYWRWLVVDVLAVDDRVRGYGLGSELVRTAEAKAVERGCTRAHTTAWAFQGLGFWQKMGYEVAGELNDYPEGHALYWLRRDLGGA